jgi:hypothetical protein
MLFSVACSVQYRTYRVMIHTSVLVYTGVPQYRQSKCHYQGSTVAPIEGIGTSAWHLKARRHLTDLALCHVMSDCDFRMILYPA